VAVFPGWPILAGLRGDRIFFIMQNSKAPPTREIVQVMGLSVIGGGSILNFVRLSLVFLPNDYGLIAKHLGEFDGTLLFRKGELLVDRAVVEIAVFEGIPHRGSIEDLLDARPVTGGHAHRAGLGGGVERAAGQLEALQRDARQTDGLHLGVPSRIVAGHDSVHAFGNDLAILDENRAEDASGAVFKRSAPRHLDGSTHEFFVVGIWCAHVVYGLSLVVGLFSSRRTGAAESQRHIQYHTNFQKIATDNA
jgi:hypothetical protein